MVLMVIELFLRCPRMEIRKGLVQLDLTNPAVTKFKKKFSPKCLFETLKQLFISPIAKLAVHIHCKIAIN